MNNEANRTPQTSLFLRLVGGGYLVYLAWDLRALAQESTLFLIAVLVFGLAGAALLVHSLVTLLRHSCFRKDQVLKNETAEDAEKQCND